MRRSSVHGHMFHVVFLKLLLQHVYVSSDWMSCSVWSWKFVWCVLFAYGNKLDVCFASETTCDISMCLSLWLFRFEIIAHGRYDCASFTSGKFSMQLQVCTPRESKPGALKFAHQCDLGGLETTVFVMESCFRTHCLHREPTEKEIQTESDRDRVA